MPQHTPPLSIGALVSVPLGMTVGVESSSIVYLRDTRFGPCFGLLDPDSKALRPLHVYPVFCGFEALKDGAWTVAGHDRTVVVQFEPPKFYYPPQRGVSLHDYGEWGLEETLDGEISKLDEERSSAVFGDLRRPYPYVFERLSLEIHLRRLIEDRRRSGATGSTPR